MKNNLRDKWLGYRAIGRLPQYQNFELAGSTLERQSIHSSQLNHQYQLKSAKTDINFGCYSVLAIDFSAREEEELDMLGVRMATNINHNL